MNERDLRILELLAKETLPLIEADLDRRDVCVLATKTGVEVLRYFGIDSRPQPIWAVVLNRQAVEWLEAGRELPKEYDDVAREFEELGAYTLQIDEQDHGIPGRYPGHLVVGLPDANAILDLSLGQFERPAKGIYLPDGGLFDLPKGFAEGEQRAPFALEDGAVLLYEARSSDRFRRGGDWKAKTPYPGKLIRSIREQLQEVPA